MSQFINNIRFYHYMSGVLVNQQVDPLCSKCKPFVNTLAAMRKDHADDISTLPGEIRELLEKAESRIISLKIPEDAEGQKKAGNCHMPKGVCLIKSSKALLKSIMGEEV